jgi:hypothetical protein
METFTKEYMCDTLAQRDIDMDTQDLAYVLKEGFVGYKNMLLVDLIEEFICCNGLFNAGFYTLDDHKNKILVTVGDSSSDIDFKLVKE